MKKEKLKAIDYYFVSDSQLSRQGTLHDVHESLRAGCTIVQYREKKKDTRFLIEEAEAIQSLCRGKALFIVNDRIDVALAVNADGVHVGQDDMPFITARKLLGPEKIIGLTVHDMDEAGEAEKLGADYIGLSPVFATGTKQDAGSPCGVSMVRKVRKHVKLPIVCIGGINHENMGEVIRAGADSAAAISAVVCADDVFTAVTELRGIITDNKRT